MRKIIVLISILLFSINSVFALDYSSYCSPKTPEKNLTGAISSVTGTSFLERRVIEYQVSKAIKREFGAKLNTNVETFFALSPLRGSFKSLTLNGENVYYDGIYFSNVSAKTICPYNEVVYKDKTLHLVQNSVFEYTGTITQNDLNKTIQNSQYSKIIDKMNSDSVISSLIKIKNHSVKISDNKLIFNYEITPLPKSDNILSHLPIKLNNFNLSFSSGLMVKDGNIELLDFGLNNNQLSYNWLLPIINKFNPTNWNINLDKKQNNNADLKIDEVNIKDSKITLKGAVIIKANI